MSSAQENHVLAFRCLDRPVKHRFGAVTQMQAELFDEQVRYTSPEDVKDNDCTNKNDNADPANTGGLTGR